QAPPAQLGGFPRDAYTPFGYLDNPHHSWALHRSGVIRSVPAIGFGFYFPAWPGGYFDYSRDALYQALLRIGIAVDGRVHLDSNDFAPGQLSAPHHSHNLFTFAFTAAGVAIEASFLQVGEDTLAAQVRLRNLDRQAHRLALLAAQEYHLGAASWWGRDGLTGAYSASGDCLTMRSFAAGTAFRLSLSEPSSGHQVTAAAAELRQWLADSNAGAGAAQAVSYFPQPLFAGLRRDLELAPGGEATLWAWMTRHANLAGAATEQRRAHASSTATLAARRRDDDAFWSLAPRLGGDWPETWRRGFVYDFETLRMMVRPAQGAYRQRWDAMQIQAPRNVLAETSLDMWALSYADPAAARELLLGQFEDAVEANVPCMRENGEMNMVAADGEACGTSIAWCYPLWCIASVAGRAPDLDWQRRLYPLLARFVRWTLAHRTDAAGYVVGKCSWETGMDASSRFLVDQPTGAEMIDFIRVVELQAAMAHAAGLLADWAPSAGDGGAGNWKRLASEYRAKTQSLWNGSNWFEDFDTRSGRAIVPPAPGANGPLRREVGQCAPVFLQQATAAQIQAMLPLLAEYRARPQYYLEWPSLVLPYLETLWTAGARALAAEVVADIADRVYSSLDRRSPTPGLGWPGVSCEMWGLRGAQGGEGYGWGATLPAHIIRSVIGMRAEGERLALCPNFPEALAVQGRRYLIDNLQFRGDRLGLEYEILGADRVRVQGRWAISGARFSATAANHERLPL
ncbi:MAG: hypothetical protein ACRD1E_07400, partial [Terriglobales bacterium]